ncbi:MAG: dTMP kinase [Alphaproteobacteria bacterium]|nr:dTMP kinase [Alphaproteobacteria bacterium]
MSDQGWLQRLAGKFVVFDGPDGSGKSTQYQRFAGFARSGGVGVCEVREPGGTDVGEQIRRILLDPAHEQMDLRCEMMLYMASRAQLVAERIRPALAVRQLVLADRFVSSTLAYQGTAGGLDLADIRRVADVAIGAARPDLVVVFDVDEPTAATRLNPLLDRMEAKGAAYHAQVRQGYLDQAQAEPDRHLVVDARPDAEAVFEQLCSALKRKVLP